MKDEIRDTRQLLMDLNNELKSKKASVIAQEKKFKKEFREDLSKIPDMKLMETEVGIFLMLAHKNDKRYLDEGILQNITNFFGNVKGMVQKMNYATNATVNTFFRSKPSFVKFLQDRKQIKQIKTVTKKLVTSYYTDYNIVLQHYRHRNKLFSKNFFYAIIKQFRLDHETYNDVITNFEPLIDKFDKKLVSTASQYVDAYEEKYPDVRIKRDDMFQVLPKIEKVRIETYANELIAKIIGFAASAAIMNYFANNNHFNDEEKEGPNYTKKTKKRRFSGYESKEYKQTNIFENFDFANLTVENLNEFSIDSYAEKEANRLDNDLNFATDEKTIFDKYIQSKTDNIKDGDKE